MKKKKEENEKKINKDLIHFKKINIFGCSKVGKSSLIQLMENTKNSSELENKGEEIYNINNLEPINDEKKINYVEQVKKIKILIDKESYLYLNCYETNIENLKDEEAWKLDVLDVLLSCTEGIIFIFDITSKITFDSIEELLPLVMDKLKDAQSPKLIPVFLINNIIDLNSKKIDSNEIKKFLSNYLEIINFELSIIDKDKVISFIKKFNEEMEKSNKINEEEENSHIVKIKYPPDYFLSNETGEIEEIKIILIGNSGVGKTSIGNRFFQFYYNPNTLNTIGCEKHSTICSIGNNNINFSLWDTAGQERFRSIPKSYYSKGEGIILVFDLSDRKSFEEINQWINDIEESIGEKGKISNNIPIFLIGNKLDLVESRKVTYNEAKELAINKGMKYFETSCKLDINIYEFINQIIFDAFLKVKCKEGNINSIYLSAGKRKQKSKCCK